MSEKHKEQLRQIYEEVMKNLPLEKRLLGMTAEDRLKGLPPEERLKGLPPEEAIKAVTPEMLELLARRLKGDSPSTKPE